jgi:hypothetical protein
MLPKVSQGVTHGRRRQLRHQPGARWLRAGVPPPLNLLGDD